MQRKVSLSLFTETYDIRDRLLCRCYLARMFIDSIIRLLYCVRVRNSSMGRLDCCAPLLFLTERNVNGVYTLTDVRCMWGLI
jgi:hypothetical protein